MKQNVGLWILICVVFTSCKTKKTGVIDTLSQKEINNVTNIKKFVKYQEGITQNFQTFYINSDVQYSGNGMSQKIHAEIAMEKDKFIFITIRFFGIVMAKALITPNQVRYYEKLGKNYYDGDFQSLSNWMGIPLDFSKIQNVILGDPISKITEATYVFEKTDSKIKLTEKDNLTINHIFEFNLSDLLLAQQAINQVQEERQMIVRYADRNKVSDSVHVILPSILSIETIQPDQKHQIDLKHASVKVNTTVNYTYTVPNGYERIYIK